MPGISGRPTPKLFPALSPLAAARAEATRARPARDLMLLDR